MAPEFIEAAASGTVLAPTAELAAALSDAVERMHVEAGHEVWPTPRIRDFGGWLREQHAGRQLTDAALPRVLGDVEERELWRSVILESEAGKGFLEPGGAVRAVRRARRAMSDYAVPWEALSEYATVESLALLEWQRRFEERCRDLHCIQSDQLLPPAQIGSAPYWIDSPAWRPAARSWLGLHGAAALVPESVTPGAARRFQAESPAAELAVMAEWARRNLQSNPRFRAWICIPDLDSRRATVGDAFDAALAPRRFSLSVHDSRAPYALAGGTPLSDHAPVRAALSTLAAGTGLVSFEAFSALLRMPQLQASPADAGAAAGLDAALRSRGPSEADIDHWLSLSEQMLRAQPANAVTAVLRLRTATRKLNALRGAQRLSRWVAVWVEAFESGPWAERQRWSSGEFQAAERFRELLAALARADDLFGSRSGESAARLLERAARDTAFQAETGIPPVWVSGQIMDPWLAYDGVWIAGCSEDRWPPPPDPIALLPVAVQRRFGVIPASADAQLQAAEDLQRRWQARARSSVFSCADPGDGRILAPSPMLQFLAPLETLPAATQPHWRTRRDRAPTLQTLSDERAPAFSKRERTRGVATIRAQSRCAFRGFAETRLMAAVLDRPTPGFNARERGEMLHRALEQIWLELGGWGALMALAPDGRAKLVGDAVSRALAEQCQRRDPGLRWTRREAPRLTRLLQAWLDVEELREPFEVDRLEQGEQTARHGGLEFSVRIDRVDRLSGGGRALIDYKTGMAAPDWRGDRPDNPQLPIYALLRPQGLVAVAYGRINAGECGFVAECERGGVFGPRSRPSPLEGMANFAELLATWSRRIDTIAREFAAGHAEVAPTLRACASCRLQPLCRIPATPEDAADAPGADD